MTMVWEAFPASGSELLCMLAMADWANDNGGSVHPSMKAVAEKIRVSEKQARRIVQGLVEAGYMAVVGNPFGGAPGTTKQWAINVKKLHELAAKKHQEIGQTPPIHGSPTTPMDVTTPTSVTPPMGVPDPSHGCPETAPMGVPDPSHPWEPNHHRTTNRTTIEPPKGKKVVEPVHLPDWLPSGAFADFVDFRKSIKKPMTVKAQELAVQELEKLKDSGQNPVDVINQSILNGWQGLFAIKSQKPMPTRSTGKHSGFASLNYAQGINDDGTFD